MTYSSYELRGLITEKYDHLEAIEITTGMNGYPSGLHAAVIGFRDIMEAEDVAKEFDGEVMEFHRRDGWSLWESRGPVFKSYQLHELQGIHEGIDENYVHDMEYSYDTHNYAIGVELYACDIKTKDLSSDDYKMYSNNIEVSHPNGINAQSSIYREDFLDELQRPIHECDARDILNEKYEITERAADEIISAMHTAQWIIDDDEVYLYKVNTYEAYRADKTGTRWMTNAPCDTADYKHEVLESITKHLPNGYHYDDTHDQFWYGKHPAELVNENDGTVTLVSEHGITKWF